MQNALVASMAAVLIEAARAGESFADAHRIWRVARFGTGAVLAFGDRAAALARAAVTQPEN